MECKSRPLWFGSPSMTDASHGNIESNEQGYYQYDRNDLRRLLVVAAALEELGDSTTTTLQKAIGHHRTTIADDIDRLAFLGIKISVTDSVSEKNRPVRVYRLVDWGCILNPEGVRSIAIDRTKREP